MASQRRKPKGKKINPTFFIFCEGESEESYINFLKSEYRLPSIHINAKIGRNDITQEYIQNYKQNKPTHEKDIDFLMYDLDVPKMLNRLNKIKDAILLVSNPCIELWYFLHYKNQTANLNCTNCYSELKKRNKLYNKGIIDVKLKERLKDKRYDAVKRARKLKHYNNPSSAF